VTANRGVVTLTGFVMGDAEKTAAERAARRVKGVTAIAEEIEVRLASDTKRADDEIAARAVDILRWNVGFLADRIKVKVESGIVTLTGEVDWQFQKTDADLAVHKLSGVVDVINQIRVASPVHAADVKQQIEKALQRSAELEASRITVETEGGRVILSGKVHAWYERDIAERPAWSAPGVTEVQDRITIEPSPAPRGWPIAGRAALLLRTPQFNSQLFYSLPSPAGGRGRMRHPARWHAPPGMKTTTVGRSHPPRCARHPLPRCARGAGEGGPSPQGWVGEGKEPA
jgi:osmotically-inducible protein OsmY